MALTGVVSVLDLGGMLCAILAQLVLLLTETLPQGLTDDGII